VLGRHILSAPRRFAVRVERDTNDPERKRWFVQTIPELSVAEMGAMTRAAIEGLYGEFTKMKAERVLKSRGIDPKAVAAG
jgi:hypothetical protein